MKIIVGKHCRCASSLIIVFIVLELCGLGYCTGKFVLKYQGYHARACQNYPFLAVFIVMELCGLGYSTKLCGGICTATNALFSLLSL